MKLNGVIDFFKTADEMLEDRIGFEVQRDFDSEVFRLCSPYVPVDTGSLQRSPETATIFGSGLVEYNTPYARRQYYTHKGEDASSAKKQDPRAGKLWFERMKADCMDDMKKFIENRTGGKVT